MKYSIANKLIGQCRKAASNRANQTCKLNLAKGKRCYSVNGFSLHCNTAINTHARDRLEKLIEYIAMGPLSNERIEITSDGKVKLKLKSNWSDGTSHLLFTPEEKIWMTPQIQNK